MTEFTLRLNVDEDEVIDFLIGVDPDCAISSQHGRHWVISPARGSKLLSAIRKQYPDAAISIERDKTDIDK